MQDSDPKHPGFFLKPSKRDPMTYRLGTHLEHVGQVPDFNDSLKRGMIIKPESLSSYTDLVGVKAEKPVVCARCHSLRHYGKVKDPTVENLLPDFDFDHTIGRKLALTSGTRSVVLMVVDAADFDGSFAKKVAKLVSDTIEEHSTTWKHGKSGNVPEIGAENGSSASLELDLEHYVVPAPSTSANSGHMYAANMTETPRSLNLSGIFTKADGSTSASYTFKDSGILSDRHATTKEMEVDIPDSSKLYSPSGMVESKSVGTFSPFQKQDSHRGLFVDRGVGSPGLVKSSSTTVADQMLGPKEDKHLAIVLAFSPSVTNNNDEELQQTAVKRLAGSEAQCLAFYLKLQLLLHLRHGRCF
ncbi:hypothetical protein ACFX1X_022259 [Malus domestica]